MLEGVDQVVADGQLVEERQVPGVEIHGPQRDGEERVGERAQRAGSAEVQQRLDHGAGEPKHDQQRRDVADHDVLEHVSDQDAVGERVQRPDLNRGHE